MTDPAADAAHRLVAILRGVTPDEVGGIVETLLDTGFRAIEIPLNSPDPFTSIGRAAEIAAMRAPGACLIGAGTVLHPEEVAKVAAQGGNLIVSPNADAAVIGAARAAGMTCLPGVFTPTEALQALAAGASGLKFFPASQLGPKGVGAIRTVLPEGTRIYAVGGVGPDDFAAYLNNGVFGFGLGSVLFKPGMSARDVAEVARAAMAAIGGKDD